MDFVQVKIRFSRVRKCICTRLEIKKYYLVGGHKGTHARLNM